MRRVLLALLLLAVPAAQAQYVPPAVSKMGTFGSSPNANGATISGKTLTLQPADSTRPGGVSVGTQTIAGPKTITTASPTNKGLIVQGTTASSSPVTPSTPSGLILWLKADAITSLSDGDPVSTWTDSSSSANNFTAAGSVRPTYKTNIINSLPVVRFDGTDDVMTATSAITTAREVFVVVKHASGTQTYPPLLGGTSTFDWHGGNGTDLFLSGATSTDVLNGTAYDNGSVVGSIVGMQKPTTFHILNFETLANTTVTNISQDRGNVGRNWQGDYAEVIIYNTILSSSNRTGVEAYLGSKYNITLPGGTPQSANLIEAQKSDGTAVVTVGPNGATALSDSLTITGSRDTQQLLITGNAVQTSNLFAVGTLSTANKLAVSGTGDTYVGSLTASRAIYADSNKKLTSSATTDTELGYVNGVTSSIQTQLNGKEASLGNPSVNGYILSSTTGGVRSWIAPGTATITSFAPTFVTKTSAYTITTSDMGVLCNSATPFTLTLPAASAGRYQFVIKNINTADCTVSPAGTDTTEVSFVIGTGTALWIVSDGVSKWWVI